MYEITVSDMTCNHCVNTVTQALKRLDVQAQVQVDLATQKIRVTSSAKLESLVAAIEGAGFPVVSRAALV